MFPNVRTSILSPLCVALVVGAAAIGTASLSGGQRAAATGRLAALGAAAGSRVAPSSSPEVPAEIHVSQVFPHPPTLRLVEAAGASDLAGIIAARSAGGDIDMQGLGGTTPLLWHVVHQHEGAVRVLLEAGADTNVVDDRGNTAAHVAAAFDAPLLLELVLEAGADPEVRSRRGHTVLVRAAAAGADACVRVLLKLGVDVNAPDARGLTALHYAVMTERAACVALLTQASADPFAPEVSGMTPVDLASQSRNTNIRALLDLPACGPEEEHAQ